jgi:hypothetical protein
VITVTVALVSLEPGDEHERPFHADHADDVAQHRFTAPLVESLFEALREAVVDHRREVLPVDPVVPVRDEQFLGTNEAQAVEELRADRVVARFAPIERQERHTRPIATARARQHAPVLVVGVRRGVHETRRRPEFQQLVPRTGRSRILGGDLERGTNGADHERHGKRENGAFHGAELYVVTCRARAR